MHPWHELSDKTSHYCVIIDQTRVIFHFLFLKMYKNKNLFTNIGNANFAIRKRRNKKNIVHSPIYKSNN